MKKHLEERAGSGRSDFWVVSMSSNTLAIGMMELLYRLTYELRMVTSTRILHIQPTYVKVVW